MWVYAFYYLFYFIHGIVISAAFKTQIYSWNSGIYCTGGAFTARI